MSNLIYKKFLKVNIKLSNQIFAFIINNCKVASNTIEGQSLSSLAKLDNYLPCSECGDCDICIKENFIKLYKQIIGWKQDLELLNKPRFVIDEVKQNLGQLQLYYKIDRATECLKLVGNLDEIKVKSDRNLKDKILIDFYLDIKNLFDIKKYLRGEEEEYFRQKAILLLNYDKFLEGIKKIRDKYFFKKNYYNQYLYEMKPELYNNKELQKNFNSGIDLLMKDFNLPTRWRGYIIRAVLKYPLDSNSNFIVPEGETPCPVPNGSPGIMRKFTINGELQSELITVGDEEEKTVRKSAEKHNIKYNYSKIKLRKTPIKNFDTVLRWFRLFQQIEKEWTGIEYNKEQIYHTIFNRDVCINTNGWSEGSYKKYIEAVVYQNPEVILTEVEKEEIEISGAYRIKKGLNKVFRILKRVK